MAALVSHAMRRYPITPPDVDYSSHGFRNTTSHQSWSQLEDTESALSRSMRYAEPWLYGSVRAPSGLLLAPALVLCSCTDYINGTKRSSKKGPNVCKKCKGTRIPLSNVDSSKFGTVRCYPTTPIQAAPSPIRAGTARVSSKSRPTILPTADPYDLMRRSRLSVAESSSQFRARSISPGKTRPNESRSSSSTRASVKSGTNTNGYTTPGRKSILECNVNPYDLMSLESEAQEASITFVSGQRIRVRPQATEPEYEDVQVRPSTNQAAKTETSAKTKIKNFKLKPNEKESECNRFKSILKKPTTTFSDTDLNGGPERSPSPAHKTGSHFYLPLPPNTPRKKVQFLVEKELGPHKENERHYENNAFDVAANDSSRSEENLPNGKEPKRGSEDSDKKEMSKDNTCKLRRSVSERVPQEPVKVVFHDTMALRCRVARNDSRDVFTKKELQKLDGVSTTARLKSFDRIRPRGPPPQPPKNAREPIGAKERHKLAKKSIEGNVYDDVNPQETQKAESPRAVADKEETSEVAKTSTNLEINSRSVCVVSKDDDSSCTETLGKVEGNMMVSAHEQGTTYEKSPVKVRENVAEESRFSEVRLYTMKSEQDTVNKEGVVQKVPPSPPPRKRSNNRQPITLNASTPATQTVQAENPTTIREMANKTIVRISSVVAPTVHKLKIRNEFFDNGISNVSISDNNQGKTSITINGDDCYCTVNVNDDVPLYHSSVVVKDAVGIKIESNNRKSSSVYITGNFVSQMEADDQNNRTHPCPNEIVAHDTLKPGTANIQENKAKEESVAKTAMCEEKRATDLGHEPELAEICSAEMLKRILNDPVEAVRRNLVPHVCGKSDVPRRSRVKKKTVDADDLVASFLNDSLLLGPAADDFRTNPVSQLLIEESFIKLRNHDVDLEDERDACSEHSSSTQYEIMDPGSDCYTDNSNRSSVTEEELSARSKFYELLAESAVEVSESEDHHYESIRANVDPIYEEIEIPPPLPANPPPVNLLDDLQLDKEFTTRSIFEGASKYDILSYLVDAKERGIVPEDSYTYNFNNAGAVIEDDGKEQAEPYNRASHMSTVSDSSEDSSLVISGALTEDKAQRSIEIERNDSGVGSETSKSSLSKYRTKPEPLVTCEDCEGPVDSQEEHEPLICRKCFKKRSERKETITEIVETEEKYSRDLQIILEEFYQPMLVAGLLTSDQLSAIFLNVEELLENSQALAERLRDAVEIAAEQGDEDLLTVNIGKLFLEAAPMLHGFETYCVRQGAASLLLASLEKEKELLRIFLRVSQMENTVLRRMNLNSFLMVPVQRVTKYPLLLARLYKVTPVHHGTREQLKEAQTKIELHLNHMNSETKDVPSKLWRRISNNPGRRSSSEMDLVNIKLRKIAVDVLEWNHEEARFALEGKLLFTQPTDNNWRKGRTIKLTPINALLVTNGKISSSSNRPEPAEDTLIFSRHSGVREAALLLVRDKNGRYSLLREPLYLDRCVIAADPAWQSYFEVQELLGKDTFIFKADDEDQTRIWYRHLQYYAQGMGAWRKRRNALANIMINGMGLRS